MVTTGMADGEESDLLFMRRAIELARHGAGLVSPNPVVGALIVRSGEIVGEGYHRYDRVKHAETIALEAAEDAASGATLYCNLEPCSHFGRTRPCTDQIIEAGVARAVIARIDPNPLVAGRGIERLRAAGIAVSLGPGESAATLQNEVYLKHVTTGRPFLHGVVRTGEPDLFSDWRPSVELVDTLTSYDGVVASSTAAELEIVVSGIERERHRSYVVVGDEKTTGALVDSRGNARFTHIRIDAGDDVQALVESCLRPGAARGAVARPLSDLRVSSVALLPGVLDAQLESILERLDRITLISDDPASGRFRGFADRLCIRQVTSSGRYREYTGSTPRGLTGWS